MKQMKSGKVRPGLIRPFSSFPKRLPFLRREIESLISPVLYEQDGVCHPSTTDVRAVELRGREALHWFLHNAELTRGYDTFCVFPLLPPAIDLR